MGNLFVKKARPEETAEEEAIMRFVNAQLENAKVNMSFIPDKMEKQIYVNIIRIILANLQSLTDTIRIEILNHVITLRIEPMVEKKEQETQTPGIDDSPESC